MSKVSSSSSPLNLPYLPDDLLLICLARISKFYYPTLSLVSKRFRSLLNSLELYETRTRLGCTESCLFVCIEFPCEYNSSRWFTLSQRPVQINDDNPSPIWLTPCFPPSRLEKKKLSDENVLVSPCTSYLGLISVGHSIYKIGGCINDEPSSRVFSMDLRSHTWHEAPSMRVPRKFPLLSVLDGKIYVVEGGKNFNTFNLIMECFDPKTQKWEYMTNVLGGFAMEGNLYLLGDNKIVVYKAKKNIWHTIYTRHSNSCCVIDNVMYYFCYGNGIIKWYDSESMTWSVLKCLKNLLILRRLYCRVKLVNYRGKIAVLWEEDFGSKKKRIWCAEISLEKCKNEEIYGKVEWCHVVLIVPKHCDTQFIAAATV